MPITYDNYGRVVSGNMPGRQPLIRRGPNGLEQFDEATLTWIPMRSSLFPTTAPAAAEAKVEAIKPGDPQPSAPVPTPATGAPVMPFGTSPVTVPTVPGTTFTLSTVPITTPTGAPANVPGEPAGGPATRPTLPPATPIPATRPPEMGTPAQVDAYTRWYNSLAPSTRAYVHAPGPDADYANAQFNDYVRLYGNPWGTGTPGTPAAATSTSTSPFAGNTRPSGTNPSLPSFPGASNPTPTTPFGTPGPLTYPGGGPKTSGLGFADGGPIAGPGGPRDDNLMIRASNGEYVIPADVVRRKGTEFFEKLTDKTREDSGANVTGVHGFADGGYIDESAGLNMDPLPASASPGLEMLPAEGGGEPAYLDPGLITEPPGTPMEQPPAPAAPVAPRASSGLGLSAYKAARTSDDQEYLKNLPLLQKVGLALESFGAGVNGQGSPIERLLENKRKREAEFRAELGTTIQNVKAGVEMLRKLPPGKARDALMEQIVRASGPTGEMVKEALSAAGTESEAQMRELMSVVEHPAAREMLTKYAAAHPDPVKAASEALKDSDFMKRLEQRVDQAELPKITAKMQLMSRAMEKMPQFKDTEGNLSFTMTDLRAQNAALPKEYQLSDSDLGVINRNQATMIAYGLRTDKTAQDEQSAIAKRKEEGPLSDVAKLNEDLSKGRITQDQFTKKIRAIFMAGEKQDAKAAAAAAGVESVVPPQHSDLHGKDYLDTLPSGVANTVRGIAEGRIDPKTLSITRGERERMLQRVTQYDPQFDQSTYGARASVQKDFASGAAAKNVTAINTAIGHMGTMSDLAEAMKNGDVQALNKVYNRIATEFGKPEVKEFEVAKSAVANELMRVFRQVGASETETKDWEAKFGSADSPEQLRATIRVGADLLQSRIDALNDQYKRGMGTDKDYEKLLSPKSKEVMGKLARTAPKASAANLPRIASDADYAALPSGAEYIAPDGSKRRKK